MTTSARPRWNYGVAAALFSSVLGFDIGVGLLVVADPGRSGFDPFVLLNAATLFTLIGGVILIRQPGNRMGWIFSAIGWLNASGAFADQYANRALGPAGSWQPGTTLAAWYSEWFWIPFVLLTFCLSVLLFPDGEPPSTRWRPLVWLIVAGTAALTLLAALDPLVGPSAGRQVPNPIGISPLGDPDEEPLNVALLLLIFPSALVALGSLVIRFVRARGEERQQLKWFTYSAVVLIVGFVGLALFDAATGGRRVPVLDSLLLSTLPIGAGIAILKYRLYDIDIIINRTLVYGALTAVLAAGYFGGVALFQALLPIEEESGIAVAASTLAIAALFRPLRARVQDFIDRRFYRSKYDAEQTIEAFSARLRDEVDLDELSNHLLDVVEQTMHPAKVSLWLRPPSAHTGARN